MGKLVASPKENQIYEIEVEEHYKFFLYMELKFNY
jgi:hypothetical protein